MKDNDYSNTMSKDQKEYFELKNRLGSEEAANKFIANQLRQWAEVIEDEGYPKVFGCELQKGIKPCDKSFIESISITLSYPWPG